MNKKEVLESQPEKAFFEEVNKLPFGKVFSEFFKENSDHLSWEQGLEGKQIFAKIPNLSSIFDIVISNRYKSSFMTCELKTGDIVDENSPLRIEIYSYKRKPLIGFHLIEKDIAKKKYDLYITTGDEVFSLLPQNKDKNVLDLISKFRQKISQYQMEKGKGAGDTSAGSFFNWPGENG